VLDDIFKLSPEELNVGFTKPFISSFLGHASIHAKSMPNLINGSAGHKLCAKFKKFASGLISNDRYDVGNFGYS